MAVIKHIAIKNSNYNAVSDYLTTKHDEYTNKPILDELGRRIPRDEFIFNGVNCDPYSFAEECQLVNSRFGKNRTQEEIKAHHYIISFDPRDRDENGLTTARAQEMGMAFAKENFPGHQAVVCTHPDGYSSAGNIHVHIVINSVRAETVDRQGFMERPGDNLAGNKHHVTKDFLNHLKAQTMKMCQQERLNQVDLLIPAKVRITDQEYWTQKRGQKTLDETRSAADKPQTKFETRNMILRKQISSTLHDSHFFDEFVQKLSPKCYLHFCN